MKFTLRMRNMHLYSIRAGGSPRCSCKCFELEHEYRSRVLLESAKLLPFSPEYKLVLI